ncbi:hypothetical protein HJC23_001331 [Cyclotella cryptica]|uniref:Uncharacterized protein n=1 Tax=Cyclotella cryptica TaxID=29204 RepID=A0ABD3NWI6_9STRA|eukprot:CCRYP_019174-RA/>CCRYP_019174-RA protein AED:0.30 eAED:0.31 QI:0/0/0/1/1/1/2/0/177
MMSAATIVRTTRAIARSSTRQTCISARFFSAQPSMEEKPLVPGIGRGKTSTGLVGLPVDHDAVPKMIIKYQALLDKLAASDMPPTATYRKNVEKICRYRIAAAQENLDDPEKVEELCNCGQVEELVIQADNEMKVMDMYLRNRWWELVKPVEVEYNPDPNDDHGDIEWGDDPTAEKK